MKKIAICFFAVVLMVMSVEGCSKSGDSEEIIKKTSDDENVVADDFIDEDEVKELPLSELLKNTDITDVLSLYYSEWDTYFVLSNDYNNVLNNYNFWSDNIGTHYIAETVIDRLGLEEYDFSTICLERDRSINDRYLGVNSNYYCICDYFYNLSWQGLYYDSPCTVEECVQRFSNAGYSDIKTDYVQAEILSYDIVSGTINSNNILWTVKVILSRDAVSYILFIPEGGIKNAPTELNAGSMGFDLEYTEKGNTYLTHSLLLEPVLRKEVDGFDFSDDKITCSETFAQYVDRDLDLKSCHIGKGKYTIGYAQDYNNLVCGYDILDDGVTMCGLRLGEKATKESISHVENLGTYYTVKKSEGIIDYLINYGAYDISDERSWYICIRLDRANTVKGISLLRSDICILDENNQPFYSEDEFETLEQWEMDW